MMEGRRLIRLSTIHQKTRSIDLDGDWVTMGVIVSKTDPKVSSKARITNVMFCTMTTLSRYENELVVLTPQYGVTYHRCG